MFMPQLIKHFKIHYFLSRDVL